MHCSERIMVTYPAEIFGDLAVTPVMQQDDTGAIVFRGNWGITHVPTGNCVPGTGGLCINCARTCAAALGEVDIDWSESDLDRWWRTPPEAVSRIWEVVLGSSAGCTSEPCGGCRQ